ncbi:MAG: alpha-glucan family phosphorylase [Candidatus Thermochlorobacter sp.]
MSENSTLSAVEARVFSTSETIRKLRILSKNLWWSWNLEAQEIFEALSPRLWSKYNHNPAEVMMNVSEQEIAARLGDAVFYENVQAVLRRFEDYLNETDTWAARHAPEFTEHPVAYFSAEFGLHESLPIYSGGLGVLAGDHIKAASDLGLNFVGISLFYREGYFQQRLSPDGWQQENYPLYRPEYLPMERVCDEHGKPVTVSVELGHSLIYVQGWAVKVGRATLYLLDTNVEQNDVHYRDITSRVYGGDSTTRINQEIVLGIGGARFLHKLGIKPRVYHMNEGHSAFLTLELLREELQSGKSIQEAIEAVRAQCVFTTHTPVPAGHDRFSPELMHYTLDSFLKTLKIDFDTLMALGRENPEDKQSTFTMTVLCLRMSRAANGVSKLHGKVSREMWKALYGGKEEQTPIGHITNGIHTNSWLNRKTMNFWMRFSNGDKEFFADSEKLSDIVDKLSDEEIWALRYTLRREMIEFVRQRLEEQNLRHGYEMGLMYGHTLSADVLTIGFARRFATYKRAPLIFTDLERIAAIINNPERPVQLVFAGKAHPRDNGGKKFIQEIYHITRMPQFIGKVIFLENYDMNITRHLISGSDVWLNTPLRPLEASGTSGQKIVGHGGLNLSILDGWWCEGYNGKNGFAIGKEDSKLSQDEQDKLDAQSLYDMLEKQVVPEFYERNADGIPKAWIERIRHSIKTLMPVYNTHRMVRDYIEKYYKTAN